VGPVELPAYAPAVLAQLGHPAGHFDSRRVEMRDQAFGVRGVNRRREGVDHLSEAALAFLQLFLGRVNLVGSRRKPRQAGEQPPIFRFKLQALVMRYRPDGSDRLAGNVDRYEEYLHSRRFYLRRNGEIPLRMG